MRFLTWWITVTLHGSETVRCWVNQDIGEGNKAVEAAVELEDEKTAIALIG
jgi:hypothetical protein